MKKIMITVLINTVIISMIFTATANSPMIKKLLMNRSFTCCSALNVRIGFMIFILILFWSRIMSMKSIFLSVKHAFRLMVKIIRKRFFNTVSIFILKSKNSFQRMNVKSKKLSKSRQWKGKRCKIMKSNNRFVIFWIQSNIKILI